MALDFEPAQKEVEEVLKSLGVTREKGLTNDEVEINRTKYGENKLEEKEEKSLWESVAEQFEDKLVRILLISALISFALAYFDSANEHEGLAAYVEPFVILTILVLNAIIGVWQERKAQSALDQLQAMSAPYAFVRRNGKMEEIKAPELVVGDIVEVNVGNQCPADIRLIELLSTTLTLDQAALTGESVGINKDIDIVDPKKDTLVPQDKKNLLFSSTSVSRGRGIGVVTAVGMKTEIGKLQAAIAEAKEKEKDKKTPLEEKLDDFSDKLGWLILIICVVVWAVNINHFFDPVHGSWIRGCIYYFKIAVALAVAAIPEGLPTVITMCLAIGTEKMAKQQCIVRKLESVETLGCTTVICSDKTGTLTQNEMTVDKLCLAKDGEMKSYDVEGQGYDPKNNKVKMEFTFDKQANVKYIAQIAACCNESELLAEEGGKIKRKGEPTEAALITLVHKLGCPDSTLEAEVTSKKLEERSQKDVSAFSNYWKTGLEIVAPLDFARDRKSMSILYHNEKEKENTLFVKGAPEKLVERCDRIMKEDGSIVPLDAAWKKSINEKIHGMALAKLRTLGLAYKPGKELKAVAWSRWTKTVTEEIVNAAGEKSTSTFKKVQCKTPEDTQGWEEEKFTADLSIKDCAKDFFEDVSNYVKAESDMVYVGMVGIKDPPREEVKPAIELCNKAGITVIMITGDNKDTAQAIATELGILKEGGDHTDCVFEGIEFEKMSQEVRTQKLKAIMTTSSGEGAVFARTEPTHKKAIVEILRDLGEIAAMTGDGVNDAPALQAADIGIAMGITGTEVAKDAAAMVLQDDNFSSIVAAVQEGRNIYTNMKAFIRYMISSNVGEVAAIFFTAALGIPEGLTPVQLLWVNLVTDGPPATALGLNPPDVDVMDRPPRRKDDSLISVRSYVRYLVVGLYVGFAVVGIFIYWFCYDNTGDHPLVHFSQLLDWGGCKDWTPPTGGWPKTLNLAGGAPGIPMKECTDYFVDGKVKASSLSLTVLVVIEMLNAFNALSEDGSFFHMPPWSNPYLIVATFVSVGIHMVVLYTPMANRVFEVVPLTMHDWVMVLAFSMPVLVIDEILKFFGRRTPEFATAKQVEAAAAEKLASEAKKSQ